MKFQLVVASLVLGTSAFSFQLRCEMPEYDRSRTQLRLDIADGKTTFFLQRRARFDRGFLKALTTHLGAPFNAEDTYRVKVVSNGIQAGTVSPRNALLGYVTLGNNAAGMEGSLEHANRTYPFKAGYFHANTELVTRERVGSSYRRLNVALNLAPIPYAAVRDVLTFTPGDCGAR